MFDTQEPSWDVDKVLPHFGHRITIALYGNAEFVANVAIECLDCCEVLMDQDVDIPFPIPKGTKDDGKNTRIKVGM
jgi:hypothetical protein